MSERRVKNALEYWQDTLLDPCPHGFFTRIGGFSKGEIASLNAGFGADEPREIVLKNRELIGKELGASTPIQTVFQHHSADVITLSEPMSGEPPKADAIVTATPNLPIGILTADCAPVLLADKNAGVIGAAHSGWRGAVGGILENTISAMRDLGATEIQAVVGPCISMNNYEVGQDFIDNLTDINPSYAEYLAGGESVKFNLPRFVLDRLREAGADADWIGECTYGDEARYYSFRRATHKKEADYGRLLSAIMLPA